MLENAALTVVEIVVIILATVGVAALLVSSLGVLRLKGVHQRMQAAGIGTSAGITLLLLSAGIHYWDTAELGRMALLILFFFATAPIASTAMARAGYRLQGSRTRRHFHYDDLASSNYVADYQASARFGAGDAVDSPPASGKQGNAE